MRPLWVYAFVLEIGTITNKWEEGKKWKRDRKGDWDEKEEWSEK
jgi:hypothetical protein